MTVKSESIPPFSRKVMTQLIGLVLSETQRVIKSFGFTAAWICPTKYCGLVLSLPPLSTISLSFMNQDIYIHTCYTMQREGKGERKREANPLETFLLSLLGVGHNHLPLALHGQRPQSSFLGLFKSKILLLIPPTRQSQSVDRS